MNRLMIALLMALILGGGCGREEVMVLEGPAGPAGPPGPTGPAGPAGGAIPWGGTTITIQKDEMKVPDTDGNRPMYIAVRPTVMTGMVCQIGTSAPEALVLGIEVRKDGSPVPMGGCIVQAGQTECGSFLDWKGKAQMGDRLFFRASTQKAGPLESPLSVLCTAELSFR